MNDVPTAEYGVDAADAETRLRRHLAATTGGMGSADLNAVLAQAARDGERLGLQFAIGAVIGASAAQITDREAILTLLRERRDRDSTPEGKGASDG